MSRNDPLIGTLNIRQLAYFLALAEHGSISVAASALNMAQPSLSENIAKLEKQLDVQLAIRGARGVQMTEAGMLLARRGREVLGSVEAMIEEIRQVSGEPRGRVSVGLSPSLSILLSVPLVETLGVKHPQVRLHIADAMTGDILNWIQAGRLDLGCVYDVSDTAPFAFEPLMTEELFLTTAPDNWKGEIGPDGVALEPVEASRLKDLPMVLTSSMHGARNLQEKYARTMGFEFKIVAEIDSLVQLIEMVSRASAYTLLSHAAVRKQVAEGTLALVPIAEPTIRRTAHLVKSRTRPVSRASSIVESHIAAILQEMVERYSLRATVHMRPDAERAGE